VTRHPGRFKGTLSTVATVSSTAVAEQFLQALEARDFERIASCFVEVSRLRALVPTALREDEGSAAVAARFRLWVGELTDFTVTDTAVDDFVDRIHVRYRMRGIDPDDGAVTCEQQAYLTLEDGAIAAMNLVCSGWRPAT
jgi:SnoaL-like protein